MIKTTLNWINDELIWKWFIIDFWITRIVCKITKFINKVLFGQDIARYWGFGEIYAIVCASASGLLTYVLFNLLVFGPRPPNPFFLHSNPPTMGYLMGLEPGWYEGLEIGYNLNVEKQFGHLPNYEARNFYAEGPLCVYQPDYTSQENSHKICGRISDHYIEAYPNESDVCTRDLSNLSEEEYVSKYESEVDLNPTHKTGRPHFESHHYPKEHSVEYNADYDKSFNMNKERGKEFGLNCDLKDPDWDKNMTFKIYRTSYERINCPRVRFYRNWQAAEHEWNPPEN